MSIKLFFKIHLISCLIITILCRKQQRSVLSFEPNELRLTAGDTHPVNVRLLQSDFILRDLTIQFLYDDRPVDPQDRIGTLPNITFTEQSSDDQTRVIIVEAHHRGHLVVTARSEQVNISSTYDFLLINIAYSRILSIFTQIVGWIYFFAWSISFYPQIILNSRRQSVVGLNFDFLALNLIGHSCYAIFNICVYTSHDVQEQYYSEHPHGVLPVLLNDVLFSVHAVCACLVTVTQCVFFDRGNQRISYKALLVASSLILFLMISTIIAIADHLSTLMLLNYFSYVKLVVTLIKYVPQAWMNKRRRSTEGWSIGNILLDITGGVLSVLQMFFLAANYNDWSSIFGSPTKFGLGLFSILFDLIFIFQHYVLYRPSNNGNSRYASQANPTSNFNETTQLLSSE